MDQEFVNAVRAAILQGCMLRGNEKEVPGIIVPNDCTLVNTESHLPIPVRKRGAFTLLDAASFILMVKDQSTAATRLYGDVDNAKFIAVFNDHEPGDDTAPAGWRDHYAQYACPTTKEWRAWTGADGKRMTQVDFAQFIEDNSLECLSPDAATMIELARTLELRKSVNFASSIRLDNGLNELTFEEKGDATAGKGKLMIPETFSLAMQVLQNGPRYQIDARLRYRMNEGKLGMWFDLVRPHKVLEAAVLDVWNEIADKTAMPILRGHAFSNSRG